MNIDVIYMCSSEDMTQIENKSVSLVVTSPPYNIDIRYGNKTAKGKVLESKGVKYSDNMDEDEYRTMLSRVFAECKRVVKDDGSIWVNIKNRLIDGEIVPPFWIQDFFRDMYLKNLMSWTFDWGGSTNKRFAPRYEFVFWFVKDKNNYTFNLDDVKIPVLNYRPDRYKSQLRNPTDVWRMFRDCGYLNSAVSLQLRETDTKKRGLKTLFFVYRSNDTTNIPTFLYTITVQNLSGFALSWSSGPGGN